MSEIKYKVQPELIPVDQQTEVQITMIIDQSVRKGETIAFALPVAWNCQRYCVTYTKEPQSADQDAPDFVTVESPNARFETSIGPIILPSGNPKGHIKKITAKIEEGSLSPGDAVKLKLKNFRAPWLAENGAVRVWINNVEETDTPRLRTLPAQAKWIRAIVPSSHKPGEPFDVKIVSLDPFWNLSCSVFRNGILRISEGEMLEEDISFTGSYTTTARINEPGVYRLHFTADPYKDTLLSNHAISNPIRITETPRGPFWGDLHSHDKMHNCGAGEHPLTYAQRVSCLDFVAVTPDFRAFSQEIWEEHVKRVKEAYEPGKFTTILGYEVGFGGGHHNVYFRTDKGEMWDVSDELQWNIESLLSKLDHAENFIVPHHVGVDWGSQKQYYPKRDEWIPLIEIYSQHGSGERYAPEHILAYEFNRTRGKEQKYASSVDRPVYVRDAWAQGRRYGVVASSDDHMGQAGKPIKGRAAIYAHQNTREALFDSMKARRTYGTTGERILIDFRINGAEMGSEIFAQESDKLKFDIEINGTDQIAFVEIARLRFDECRVADFEEKEGIRCRVADFEEKEGIRGKWEKAFYERLVERDLFQEGKISRSYDYTKSFEQEFESDALYYLRMAQRRTVDDYPVFAWSSPIWVTKRV